jgi:hypothetical protein
VSAILVPVIKLKPPIKSHGYVDSNTLVDIMHSAVEIIGYISSCVKGITKYLTTKERGKKIPFAKSIPCLNESAAGCLLPQISFGSRKRSSWNENSDVALVQVPFITEAMINFRDMLTLLYGDVAWLSLSCIDQPWEDAVARAQQSTSDMGSLLSRREYDELMIVSHQCENRNLTSDHLLYYNRTIHWYSINVTEPDSLKQPVLPFMSLSQYQNRNSKFMTDTNYSRTLGYSSLIEAQNGIHEKYRTAHADSPVGVYTVVTIKILQRVTIVRQGVDAESIIENGGADSLLNIEAILNVRDENNTVATH